MHTLLITNTVKSYGDCHFAWASPAHEFGCWLHALSAEKLGRNSRCSEIVAVYCICLRESTEISRTDLALGLNDLNLEFGQAYHQKREKGLTNLSFTSITRRLFPNTAVFYQILEEVELSHSDWAYLQGDMKTGSLWSHTGAMRWYLGRETRHMEWPRDHPARAHTPHKPERGAGGRLDGSSSLPLWQTS